jgi:hypothetical protein
MISVSTPPHNSPKQKRRNLPQMSQLQDPNLNEKLNPPDFINLGSRTTSTLTSRPNSPSFFRKTLVEVVHTLYNSRKNKDRKEVEDLVEKCYEVNAGEPYIPKFWFT